MTNRRVVVTGTGVLASCGIGKTAFWEGINKPDYSNTCTIEEFDPLLYFDSPKSARRQDRFSQFAMACTIEALEQANVEQLISETDPNRIGVHIGTGVGGLGTIEEQVMVFNTKGDRWVSPFLVPMLMANAASAAVSIKYGFSGPCETTTTACAAGTHSIGNAWLAIKYDRCDVMITGGSEASNTPTGRQAFVNMTATSKAGISRPFDLERDGFIHSEGCGILVIEELEHAKQRGANILGEIIGYASNADAHHITAPSPQGAGAVHCMELAIASAGIKPKDITYVNAHGTSTPLNDANEAEAIMRVFGSSGPAVTSTKGVTGHALGASGGIEAVGTMLSLQNKQIPPTANHKTLDPKIAPINIVNDGPQAWEPGPAISNSFGFGGHNATLVMDAYRE